MLLTIQTLAIMLVFLKEKSSTPYQLVLDTHLIFKSTGKKIINSELMLLPRSSNTLGSLAKKILKKKKIFGVFLNEKQESLCDQKDTGSSRGISH